MTVRHRARRPERGTALMLVPALVAVVLGLGAIAVDGAVLHAAHRSIHRVVSAAADDAAGALDSQALRTSGEIRIDADRARRLAHAHLAAARLPGQLVGPAEIELDDDGTMVRVTATVRVTRVLASAIPGTTGDETLRVSAAARLHR